MAKKMFVYFSENGDIKSISPVQSNELVDMRSAELLVDEVKDFLTGKKNIHRYAITEDSETGKFKFISKDKERDQLTTIDYYLTEITNEYHNDYDIMIEHDVRRKHIRVTMSGTGSGTEARKLKTLVSNYRKLTFYFTLFGDPNMLLCSFDVPVTELLDGQVFINLEHLGDELNNATLFTKKILGKYHYRKLLYT